MFNSMLLILTVFATLLSFIGTIIALATQDMVQILIALGCFTCMLLVFTQYSPRAYRKFEKSNNFLTKLFAFISNNIGVFSFVFIFLTTVLGLITIITGVIASDVHIADSGIFIILICGNNVRWFNNSVTLGFANNESKSEYRILGVKNLCDAQQRERCGYIVYRLTDKDKSDTSSNRENITPLIYDLEAAQRMAYVLNKKTVVMPDQYVQYVDFEDWYKEPLHDVND